MYGPQPDNTRRHINVSHLHQCKYYYKTSIYKLLIYAKLSSFRYMSYSRYHRTHQYQMGNAGLTTLHTNGVMRFNDIQKSIGEISQRMLTVTLRSLETDGLIKRTVYPEVPPRVEYKLTLRGESLMPILKMLTDWALDHAEEIMKDRQK